MIKKEALTAHSFPKLGFRHATSLFPLGINKSPGDAKCEPFTKHLLHKTPEMGCNFPKSLHHITAKSIHWQSVAAPSFDLPQIYTHQHTIQELP